jgi:phosphatidylglycerophosphate synthase
MNKLDNFILKNKWLSADLLTASRFVFSLPLLILVINGWYLAAFFIFVIFSLTDVCDGYVARLKKTDKEMGTIFDGLTDMIFFLPSFLILGLRFLNPAVLFTLLSMEILRVFSALLAKLLKFKFKLRANLPGKIKAWFEGFGLAAILLNPSLFSNLANIFFVAAIILAAINLLMHLYRFLKSIEIIS